MNRPILFALAVAALAALPRCYSLRGNSGGADITNPSPRKFDADGIAVPKDYRVELVASKLNYPTGVAFDADGKIYVVESGYCYGEDFATPRIVRIDGGRAVPIAEGESDRGPWNGIAFHGGAFYVAEGGTKHGGRILRIGPDGTIKALVENLPTFGDHHCNGPAIGADGAIYFGIGAATNSAIVGEDNAQFGWLKRKPDFCDIPGQDIVLAGFNAVTADPLHPEKGEARTGAFVPFGTATEKGQVIRGRVPCTGAILKIPAGGGDMQLVAWGFRNPFGLAFAPDGTLYATDNGYDDRGSRRVWGAGELLWAVKPGTWYGFPDFSGDRPLTDEEFEPPGEAALEPLLAEYPNRPPKPAAILDVHGSADGLDFSRNARFGFEGDAFIAMFGDQSPTTGELLAPSGFKVVRVKTKTGVVTEFAANRGSRTSPASENGGGGFERPIAVRFDPEGTALYVVDFGIVTEGGGKTQSVQDSGALWRIVLREPVAPASKASVALGGAAAAEGRSNE